MHLGLLPVSLRHLLCTKRFPAGGSQRPALPAVLAVLAAVSLWAGASQARAEDRPDRVRLQLRWDHQFQFAGYYAARWQGFYAREGIEVEFRPFFSPEGRPRAVTREVAEGNADFGVGGADILLACDRGTALTVVATIFHHSAVRYYYRQDTPIANVADLAGLRIARRGGDDLVDIELLALLKAEGIEPASITFVPQRVEEGYFADLMARRVDLVPGYSIGSTFEARRHGYDLRILDPAEFGVRFYGDSLFCTRRLARERPDLLARFRRATQAGWQYALEHPNQIAERIIAEYEPSFPIDDWPAFVRSQTERVKDLTLYPAVEIGHTSLARWRRMHELLRDAGVVSNEFPGEALVWTPPGRRATWLERNAWLMGIALLTVLAVALGAFLWAWTLNRTVRRRTAQIAHNQRLIRSLLDASSDCAMLIDRARRVQACNGNVLRTVGMSEQEVLGMDLTELVEPDVAEQRRRRAEEVFTTGRPLCFEDVHRGRRVEHSLVPVADERGQVGQIALFVRDVTLQRTAEEAIRRSEAKYRAVFEWADIGIALARAGKILEVNDAMVRIIGFPVEEMVGDGYEHFTHPDDLAREQALVQEIFEGKRAGYRIEKRYIHADGRTIWGTLTVSLVGEPAGRDSTIVGMVEDITARKEAEAALRESERQKAMVLEATQEMIAYYDLDRRIRWVNRAGIAFAGRAESEIVGKPCWEVWHDRAEPCETCPVADTIRTGDPAMMELATPDGRWWVLRAYPIFGDDGELIGVTELGFDITQRRQADAALREAERKYRAVADFTYDWEYWLTPEGRLAYVSPSVERITGHGAGEFAEDPELLLSLVDEADRDAVAEHLRIEQDPHADPTQLEFRLAGSNGDAIWIGHTCQAVIDDEGRFLGRRASNRDITHRKQVEQQVLEDAEEKAALLREVNHRVKNNLAAILGLLQMERRRLRPDREPQEMLDDLAARVRGLLVVHNLLIAARWTSVSLGELARNIIRSGLQTCSADRTVSWQVQGDDPDLAPSQAHNLALVLNELVTNTCKYGLAEEGDGSLGLSVASTNGRLRLCYRDSGPGYPDGILQARDDGLGLGLKLTRDIVRGNLGGEISLRNDGGAVTEISVDLAAGREDEQSV